LPKILNGVDLIGDLLGLSTIRYETVTIFVYIDQFFCCCVLVCSTYLPLCFGLFYVPSTDNWLLLCMMLFCIVSACYQGCRVGGKISDCRFRVSKIPDTDSWLWVFFHMQPWRHRL